MVSIRRKDVIEIVVAFIAAWLFYQGLSFATGTDMPMVSVVSDSMYHTSGFGTWWNWNNNYYESLGITKEDFTHFVLPNGLSRGDLLLSIKPSDLKVGDIIIYRNSERGIDIVHRIIKIDSETFTIKGDNNPTADPPVARSAIRGKVIGGLPLLGYPRLMLSFAGI